MLSWFFILFRGLLLWVALSRTDLMPGAVPLPRRLLSQGFWCSILLGSYKRPFDLSPLSLLLAARVSSLRLLPLRALRLSPFGCFHSSLTSLRLSSLDYLRCSVSASCAASLRDRPLRVFRLSVCTVFNNRTPVKP